VGAYASPGAPAWAGPSLTPAIDRLAAESDLFLDAYSTFNVTNPSFASILTGLYGKNHGVYDLKTPLPPAHTTLAEVFDRAGYDTLAVIAARHLGDHNSGLGQGFDATVRADEHLAAEMAVETAMDWIAGREAPFFLWLHLFDPHTPHTPPSPYALGLRPAAPAGLAPVAAWLPFRSPGPAAYEQPVLAGSPRLYAGEVAYLDRQVDRLLDYLESRGLLKNTLVALVADHGENLGEHGMLCRHIGLWETTTRVPLLVRWPGPSRPGRRIAGLVETIDLFPTLLAAAGLPVPPQDGTDLRELTRDGRRGRPAVFAEHASRMGVTVRSREFRYVRSAGNPHLADGPYLYELATDPGEARSLAGSGLAAEASLATLLDRWLAELRPAPGASPRELTAEELERLRSLGYL
jgi:arylsulfatase A-like enzyme